MPLTFKKFYFENYRFSKLNEMAAVALTTDDNIIRKLLISALNKNANKLQEYKLNSRGSNARANKEVLRASNIGKTKEDVEKNVKQIFSKLNSENLNIKITGFGDFGVGLPGGSGKYNSLEVNVKVDTNGETYNGSVIITSTTNDKGKLKNKDLVPNKFVSSFNKEISKSELIQEVSSKLESNIELDTDIKTYLIDIINSFKTVSENRNFAEYISNPGELVHQFNTDIKTISPADINNILKDFGEIIQPLIFASKFNNVNIEYPVESNGALIDFSLINGGTIYNFSAKAGSKGGIPSGKTYFDNINSRIINGQNMNLSNNEKEFIKMMSDSYAHDIRTQQCALVYDLLVKTNFFSNNKIKSFYEACLSGFKPGEKIDYKKFISNANEWLENNVLNHDSDDDNRKAFTEFWENLYKEFDYIASKDYSADKMFEKFKTLNPETQYGTIMYAPYKESVNILNSNYRTLLSDILKKTQNFYQSYLTVNGDTFVVKVKSSKNENYKFATGGMSTNNITNAKLGIALCL